MFWIVVGVVVLLFLAWMWRIDRRDRGSTRNLGWGRSGSSGSTPGLTGGKPGTNAAYQLSKGAFETEAGTMGGRTAPRPSPRDERQLKRRFSRRGRGQSSATP